MTITFNIAYNTSFGEELVLNVAAADGSATPYRMRTNDGRTWTRDIKADLPAGRTLTYHYSVAVGGDLYTRREWLLAPHRLEPNAARGQRYVVNDRWNDLPEDSYLYSSAFTDCVARRRLSLLPACAYAVTLRLKTRAPRLRGDERLVLVGADAALGAWNPRRGVTMYERGHNEWAVDIDVTRLSSATIEYKFVAMSVPDGERITWEDGANRRLTLSDLREGDVLVAEQAAPAFDTEKRRFAGTLVPVFSLRSESSFGVGDFGDLKKMIDWVALTGQRLLQVLPINDTTNDHTWMDSYPYNCVSVFALHPQYVDLTALPALADEAARERLEALRLELNALGRMDYVRVNKAKDEYLRLIYAQEGDKALASEAFKTFFDEAKPWLVPYARFCYLRDKYGTADFSTWPKHRTFDEGERLTLATPGTEAFSEVAYYYYAQFVLDAQMSAAHEHARTRGVILKGDIPIGVSRHGCDAWQTPRYFNMSGQAGAPPDDFSRNGQNWGFPTYNWDEMMKDGCQWWRRRFSNMARYFDAYRIDHVLGFFRIWEIPVHSVHGLLGQFSPSLGMTREEIEAHGLPFNERLFTEPYITDELLARLFGDKAKTISETYLEPTEDGRYLMRKEYDTQIKVKEAFAGKTTDEEVETREKLYSLISNVLFVRDREQADKFHPRVTAQLDYAYEVLPESDKHVFNRIYDDYFYRRNNQYWYREAMTKLPKLVEATRMLVCAEDLGMVPECVPWVMDELRILSLELQSMPKEYGVRFGRLSTYPYRSVCTISSHDMPTLRQWWDEDTARARDYYNSMLGKQGDAPHPLPGWLARDIVARHLECPSMLCVLAIQDWLAIDERLRLPDANAERINIPANPRHYWRYRTHLTLERLLADSDFNQNVADLVRQAGRA